MFTTSYLDPFAGFSTFGLLTDPRLRRIKDVDSGRARRSAPHFETRTTEHEYIFRFDVPGLRESDFELEVHGQTLTVRAERKHEPPAGFTAHRIERPSFRLAQSFSLPTRVDVDAVTATLEHGVLTLTLPKAPEAQPRRIEIKNTHSSEAQS